MSPLSHNLEPGNALERWGAAALSFLQSPRAAFAAACLFLAYLIFSNLGADPDLFARTAVGELVRSLGYVPHQDPFAFSPRKAVWVDHEWLAGVVFSYIAQYLGDIGLVLIKLLAAAYSILFLLRAGRLYSGRSTVPVFWLLLTVLAVSYVWASTVRSQLFTYFFLPLFLYAFAEHRRLGRKRFLLLLPLCMIVWVNAHGGFVVGLGLFFIYVLSLLREPAKLFPAAAVFSICLAATALNPYGPVVFWSYILEALSLERATITEWAPLDPFSLPALIPDVLLLLLLAGAWRSRRSLDIPALVFVLVSAYFGYRHLRLAAIFMMTAYVYGGEFMRAALAGAGARSLPRLQHCAALAMIILLPLMTLQGLRHFSLSGGRLDFSAYPDAAAEWLWCNKSGGKVLVDFNTGSFVLWRLFPRFQVSLDGRYEELYPESTLSLVVSAMRPGHADHARSLELLNPDFILLPAGSRAERFRGWHKAYEGAGFMVLEKDARSPAGGKSCAARSMWQPRLGL